MPSSMRKVQSQKEKKINKKRVKDYLEFGGRERPARKHSSKFGWVCTKASCRQMKEVQGRRGVLIKQKKKE